MEQSTALTRSEPVDVTTNAGNILPTIWYIYIWKWYLKLNSSEYVSKYSNNIYNSELSDVNIWNCSLSGCWYRIGLVLVNCLTKPWVFNVFIGQYHEAFGDIDHQKQGPTWAFIWVPIHSHPAGTCKLWQGRASKLTKSWGITELGWLDLHVETRPNCLGELPETIRSPCLVSSFCVVHFNL